MKNFIERISVASDGTQANGYSGANSLSDDGRFVSFESNASNLVTQDLNGHTDTFIYDRLNNTVELITLADDGTQANASSNSGSISGNGRYVTYASFASNLVSGDTNNQRDIFVYDRVNKTTGRVNLGNDGTQANGASLFSVIGDDSRYVAFESVASNLVTGDTNGLGDIFLRDRIEGTTKRVNVANNGTQANGSSVLDSMSDDGRYISFTSDASNLVSGDTNGVSDIFVYDRINQTTERINLASNGSQANATSGSSSLSGNGRYVVYQSDASNLVSGDTNKVRDIFVYDRQTKNTQRVDLTTDDTQSNGDSQSASISDDGKYVAFESDADNLVSGTTNAEFDVFLRDLDAGTTEKIEANSFPVLSGDAQHILFNSSLSTLVANDTNDVGDVFAIDLVEPEKPEPENPGTEPPKPEPENPGTEPPKPEPENPGTEQPKPEPENPGTEQPKPEPENPGTEQPEPEEPGTERFTTEAVHRFYQFEIGSHLYTTDANEISHIQKQSAAGELSYTDEGEKFSVLADNKDTLTGQTIEGVQPVYRFFNTDTGAHLYTTDENEKAFIEANLANYSPEGIKYYAFESEPQNIETIPVYRLLNSDSGSHLYTIDSNELSYIQDNLSNFTLENNGEATFHVLEL